MSALGFFLFHHSKMATSHSSHLPVYKPKGPTRGIGDYDDDDDYSLHFSFSIATCASLGRFLSLQSRWLFLREPFHCHMLESERASATVSDGGGGGLAQQLPPKHHLGQHTNRGAEPAPLAPPHPLESIYFYETWIWATGVDFTHTPFLYSRATADYSCSTNQSPHPTKAPSQTPLDPPARPIPQKAGLLPQRMEGVVTTTIDSFVTIMTVCELTPPVFQGEDVPPPQTTGIWDARVGQLGFEQRCCTHF